MLRELWSRIAAIWCSLSHHSLMWPSHGHYACRKCGRRYPAFAETRIADRTKHPAWEYAGY